MSSNLFVHIPAQLFAGRMPFLLNRKLQPEVACQEISIDKLDLGQMRACAVQLADLNLRTTVHAPFNNFNPGSPKKRLQKTAHTMCQQSLQLAEALNARCIVFHPGIPYQAPPKQQQLWLENALKFWPEYIAQAAQQNTIITLENIYELHSNIFEQLFSELAGEHFGHCFDIGHWNIYSEQKLDDWFARLGRFVKHLHLHDNFADYDSHLALGEGTIDFNALFAQVKLLPTQPSMTLEAQKLPVLEISLQQISDYLAILEN